MCRTYGTIPTGIDWLRCRVDVRPRGGAAYKQALVCNNESLPPEVWDFGSAGSAAVIMSGRKSRSVANPLESAITTPSERILKECHGLYVDAENGK